MRTMEAGNPQVVWQNLIRAETQPPSIFYLAILSMYLLLQNNKLVDPFFFFFKEQHCAREKWKGKGLANLISPASNGLLWKPPLPPAGSAYF